MRKKKTVNVKYIKNSRGKTVEVLLDLETYNAIKKRIEDYKKATKHREKEKSNKNK